MIDYLQESVAVSKSALCTLAVRHSHSLSVWSVTPDAFWVIEFGGFIEDVLVNDAVVIELGKYFIDC